MIGELILERGTTLVRRLLLAPGEAMPWHRDPYHRVTVVLSGEEIAIELRESGERISIPVTPGQVDWDEPTAQFHRGVNVGNEPYEEVVIFFLDRPGADPQPVEE
jgi:quercetin dioxygenase-like cupin family protein